MPTPEQEGGRTDQPHIGGVKGTKTINSRKAAQKLAELGFDPIEKMTEMYNNIEIDMANMMFDEDGNMRKNFSQVAYSALAAIKQKVVADLLRFGYARATESTEVTNHAMQPITIKLSSGESFDPASLMAVPDDDGPMKGDNE
jgi:hypothetical protein